MVDTTPVTSRVEILFLFLCRSFDDLERHPVWMITMTDDFGTIKVYNEVCLYADLVVLIKVTKIIFLFPILKM